MLKISLEKSVLKFCDKLPPKQYRQIFKKILSIAQNPVPPDAVKLKGDSCLRADIGEYRIIYEAIGDILFVRAVGKRNDSAVYKRYFRR